MIAMVRVMVRVLPAESRDTNSVTFGQLLVIDEAHKVAIPIERKRRESSCQKREVGRAGCMKE